MDPGKYNRRTFILAAILIFVGGFFVFQNKANAGVGINEQINFQGKLVNADGTNITDGTYNMEFKIYQDGDGVPGGGDETIKWTESRLRNNSQGVTVTDGIFQVNLGAVTAFSGIDWNQSVLWVSINVGDTNASCTPFSNCTPDGEMNPMIRFTATPYSLNSNKLQGSDWASPAAIGTGTAAAGTFTDLTTNTGGVSIAAGQAYGGAGAVTLSSTTNGLTLNSGNNILTIDSSDTSLTASGVTTLTLAAEAVITNASGNLALQPAGTGTANVQIGDGGAASATPDVLVLDIGSAEPTGSIGAMYYSTALNKFRCYQLSGWTDCIVTAGGTAWNAISVPTGDLILAMDADATNFNWDTITTQTAFNLATASTTATSYDILKLNHTASMADTTTVSGNLLDISRALTIDSGGARSITVNSPVVAITDNCIEGVSDVCTHSGNVLALTQSFATSTGSALAVTNAGTGAGASFTLSNAAGTRTNGLLLEQTGAGTTTDAISILETAGAITTGINIGNNVGTGIAIGTGVTTGISVGSGGITITAGALAVNSDSITSDGNLVINATTTDIQDAVTVDSLTADTGGVSIASNQSYTGAGIVTLSSATASALTINSGTTGAIGIGDDASAEAINLGTGAADKDLTIGSTTTGSTIKIQSGSASGITIEANGTGTGNVQIGDGGATSATPDMLVLDIGSAEPSGTVGAMYYSTATSKFRCYEGAAWKDCDTTGGGGVSDGDKGDVTVSGSGATWNVDFTSTDGAGATSNASGLEEGTGGIGLLQGCSDGQILKWTESTSTWACAADSTGSGGAPDTASFTDSSPAAMADNNTTELFNDATKPNIVTDSTSATVLVSIVVNDTTAVSTDDEFDAVTIWRRADGTNPTCGGASPSVQVGTPIQGGFVTAATHPWSAAGTFLDSPGTAGTIKYTVCTSSQSYASSGVNNTPTSVVVTLVELGADLAENYYTNDDSIEPGDLVAIEGVLPAGVKKSDHPYDSKTIGVVSTAPGITLDDAIGMGQGRAVPVALAGRIPVKVSTENGRVKAGDYLTASSIPGVAMKATKSGVVVGQALQNFSYADGEIGLVVTFVKNTYFDGEKFINDITGESLVGKALLQKMLVDKMQSSQELNISEITTDKISAGLEIVTPKVIAETAAVDKIEAATGLDVAMNISDGGAFKINNAATGENGIVFDNAGNATFQGTVTADAIVANKILGLEIYTNQMAGIDENVSVLAEKLAGLQSATEKAIDLSPLGISEKKGGLLIAKEATFKEDTIFEKMATLLGNVIFRGTVSFEKVPTFSSDMAGYAIIKEGGDRVKVSFEEEYAVTPIINASVSLQYIKDDEVRAAAEELLLTTDVKYIITNVTAKGFEIKINSKADSDIPFSWQALAVKDAKTFKSKTVASSEDRSDESDSTENVSEPAETIAPIQAGDNAVVAAPVESAEPKESTTVNSGETTSAAETVSVADPSASETVNSAESAIN